MNHNIIPSRTKPYGRSPCPQPVSGQVIKKARIASMGGGWAVFYPFCWVFFYFDFDFINWEEGLDPGSVCGF